MANVQTRRSISFALADFEAAQELAARLGVPIAQLAAQALRELIARNPERLVITPMRQVSAVAAPPPPVIHPAEPTPDLAIILQADLEARVGLLPRGPKKPEPFDLPAARRIIDVERAELEQEMADHPDAGEVQVVYDDAPPRSSAKRKRR